MSLRSRFFVWSELMRARLRALTLIRPEATEMISAVAAAALAIPVLMNPMLMVMADQYQGALEYMGVEAWSLAFLTLSLTQGLGLLLDCLRLRQIVAGTGVVLWGAFGLIIAISQPPAVDGWAYVVLGLACAWAVWQIGFHHRSAGGGDA